MRLTFERDGGFAAFPLLDRPVTIDTDQLSAEQASRWQQLVAGARAWDHASPPLARPGGDRRSYRLSLEDGDRRIQLTLHDPLPAELRPLVRALEAHAKGR